MKKLLFLLIMVATLAAVPAQLYTGSTIQFGAYTGPIGVGAPATGPLANLSNLYVTRNADGMALFASNTYNNITASGIFAMSIYGVGLNAYTQSGYAVYGTASLSSGYAGRFDGAVWLDRINANLSTGAASFNANTAVSDGASLQVFPNTDPAVPGGVAIVAGEGNGNGGEIRFQRYDNGSSSYVNQMVIKGDGRVGIGDPSMTTTGYKLYVKEGIATGKVKVDQAWADYVFSAEYELPSLAEVGAFIQKNKHLPNVPSEAELETAGGFELGDMTRLQQEKIEELFLYIIRLEKRVKELEAK